MQRCEAAPALPESFGTLAFDWNDDGCTVRVKRSTRGKGRLLTTLAPGYSRWQSADWIKHPKGRSFFGCDFGFVTGRADVETIFTAWLGDILAPKGAMA